MKGRSAYPLRYPLLTAIFFFGIPLAVFGIAGAILAFFSFFLFLAFAILSLVSAFTYPRKKYYVTSRRIISGNSQVGLERLVDVRIESHLFNSFRSIADLNFDSAGYTWLKFERVHNPEMVREQALRAKASLPPPPAPKIPMAQTLQQVPVPIVQNVALQPPIVREREVVIREILVVCPYCGTRSPQGLRRCSNCGAKI